MAPDKTLDSKEAHRFLSGLFADDFHPSSLSGSVFFPDLRDGPESAPCMP